jgi:hypothetical protein
MPTCLPQFKKGIAFCVKKEDSILNKLSFRWIYYTFVNQRIILSVKIAFFKKKYALLLFPSKYPEFCNLSLYTR